MAQPLRLLLVEDSEEDAELLALELNQAGYQLDCCRVETAPEFVRALADQEWDLIIADYHLPQFNALEALRICQAHGLDLPFLIVSGTVGEETAVAAMKAGAHDYLMKDNLNRLGPAIARELREAQGRAKQRNAEAALQDLQNQQEMRKLKASFFSMLSHELKNPLGAMKTATDLLENHRDKLSAAKVEQYFQTIRSGIEQINHLLNDLLMIGKVESGRLEFQPAPVNVEWFCQELIESVQLSFGLGHFIQLRVHDRRPAPTQTTDNRLPDGATGIDVVQWLANHPSYCLLDGDLLRHILLNLLSNAIKYSPDATPILIDLIYSTDLTSSTYASLMADIATMNATLDTALNPPHPASNNVTPPPASSDAVAPPSLLEEHWLDGAAQGEVPGTLESTENTPRSTTWIGTTASSASAVHGETTQAIAPPPPPHLPPTPTVANLGEAERSKAERSPTPSPDGWITIRIQDWGIGIPPEDLTKLFDSFYRAQNVGEIPGTGLGLTIVKQCAELHGGQVTVESTLGVGTVFSVLLPFNSGNSPT